MSKINNIFNLFSSFIKKNFCITYTNSHVCVNLLGIKFNFKKGFIGMKKYIKINSYKNNPGNFKRAIIFACYQQDGIIPENTVKYLSELKKNSDYLICISDNPIKKNEQKKIDKIVDSYIFKRHKEYDFGSYKRGFQVLKRQNILNKVDNIIFCNDSVLYVGDSLNELINETTKYDCYGVTATGKFDRCPLHIQSYFLSFSEKIFQTEWFCNFFNGIKKLKLKDEIILNYEIGLSQLLIKSGFELHSYYKCSDDFYEDPQEEFLSYKECKNKLFIKKKYVKEEA